MAADDLAVLQRRHRSPRQCPIGHPQEVRLSEAALRLARDIHVRHDRGRIRRERRAAEHAEIDRLFSLTALIGGYFILWLMAVGDGDACAHQPQAGQSSWSIEDRFFPPEMVCRYSDGSRIVIGPFGH